MALDGVRLRPRVDCALDAGHGWVPCVINISRLKLDLNYLPALYRSQGKGEGLIKGGGGGGEEAPMTTVGKGGTGRTA